MNIPKKVAYHEAGHAVIARLLGVEIDGVPTPTQDEDFIYGTVTTRSAAHGTQRTSEYKSALLTDIKIALAGPAAERRYNLKGYKKSRCCGGHNTDRANAINFACLYCFGDEIIGATVNSNDLPPEVENLINEAERLTIAMVRDNWSSIKSVADLLFAGRALTQTDVDAAIQRRGLIS